jgi:CRP-like cAMP-binding protein
MVSLRDLRWRRRRFAIAIVATGLVFALALVITGIRSATARAATASTVVGYTLRDFRDRFRFDEPGAVLRRAADAGPVAKGGPRADR